MHMILFSLLGVLDLLTTYSGISTYEEGNPLGEFLCVQFGFIALILLKVLGTTWTVLTSVLLRRVKWSAAPWYDRALVGMAFFPVVWNLWVLWSVR